MKAGRVARKARLIPASNFKCTDCNRMAVVYDHRDYMQPEMVEPVCLTCNCQRGCAAWVDKDGNKIQVLLQGQVGAKNPRERPTKEMVLL